VTAFRAFYDKRPGCVRSVAEARKAHLDGWDWPIADRQVLDLTGQKRTSGFGHLTAGYGSQQTWPARPSAKYQFDPPVLKLRYSVRGNYEGAFLSVCLQASFFDRDATGDDFPEGRLCAELTEVLVVVGRT
jgi:hypothetical protein